MQTLAVLTNRNGQLRKAWICAYAAITQIGLELEHSFEGSTEGPDTEQ